MNPSSPPPSIDSNRPSTPPAAAAGDLGARTIRAAKSGLVLSVARVALQLISQIVLARILGPDSFGVFGLALVAFTFTIFVSEFGFGMLIMQKPLLEERDIRLVFTWQMTLGLAAALILFAASGGIAAWYGDSRIETAIRWMALACLLNAATATGAALLARDLDFRSIGIIDLIGYAIGYLVVGFTMALQGYGVEALIAAWLVHASIKAVLTLLRRPHPKRPLWRGPAVPMVLATGARVLLTNIVNGLLQNVDRVIIGRQLSAHAVGLYNVGNNLATTAGSLLISALQPTFLSGGARVQEDPQRLGRVWVQIFATIWTVAAPVFVISAAIAPAVIGLLYGDRWRDAAGVLAALLIGMPFYLTAAMATPVLWNRNLGHREPLLQLPVLLVGGAALFALTSWGVQVAAWVVTGMYALRALVLAVAACHAVPLPVSTLAAPLARGAFFCLLTGVLAWLCRILLDNQWPGVVLAQVLIGGCLPGLILIGLVLLRPALLGAPATAMVLRIAPGLERWLVRATTGPGATR